MSTLSPAETARRLRLLAATLDTVDETRFDMRTWIKRPPSIDYGPDHPITLDDFRDCGTSACALGWAYTVEEFRELGLGWNELGGIVLRTHGRIHVQGDDAGAELFGITLYEANTLFCANFDATPAMKAEELRLLADTYDSKRDPTEDMPDEASVSPRS